MYCQIPRLESKALSTLFFTKEFAGFEVESKWQLLTENPVPTVLRFVSDINSNKWKHVQVAKSMGQLPIGLRYFELRFDFWAIPDKENRLPYRQIAMVAVMSGSSLCQVAFKSGDSSSLLCDGKEFRNPPLVRREERKGDWVSESQSKNVILNRFPTAKKVATMKRQKCFIYIHNIESHRNFSISADFCRSGSKTLSQVEIEYKGRNGIWLPDTTGHQISLDFLHLHNILSNLYDSVLVPTTQTKFQWIMGK